MIFFINVPFGVIAVFICNAVLEDPPYARKQNNVKTDGIGFLFLVVWLVTLQIVLDKGNNSDWFNATWVCWTSAVSAVACIAFCISQLKNKESLIDLSVFKDKNFLNGTIILVVINLILYAALAILPQFLQVMLGYTAFLSGLSMMPRGAGCLIASVLSGVMVIKLGIKPVVIIGLVILAAGSMMFGEINTSIALANIAIPNFTFGVGMILTMVPLSNISCATLNNEDQTNAAGLQNLVKNVGAAIGTSIATTMISRFSQVHQMTMVNFLSEGNNGYLERLQSMTSSFLPLTDLQNATYMAQTQIYGLLKQQATFWGYVETFRYFAVAVVFILPFVFFLNENKQKAKKQENQA